jgi:ligand-binding sensor domain-containing protein
MKIPFPLQCFFLLGLLPPAALQAHNGASLQIYPLDGIVLDGDLSDWPADLPSHPLTHSEYGEPPLIPEDLQASFSIGYNASEQALYVAVDVADESVVIDSTAEVTWNSHDGCEVYLNLAHGGQGTETVQYSAWGHKQYIMRAMTRAHEGVVRLGEGEVPLEDRLLATALGPASRQYEWRIDLERPLDPGTVIGLDVGVYDRDADGGITYQTWGPGAYKLRGSAILGDGLVMLAGAQEPVGLLPSATPLPHGAAQQAPASSAPGSIPFQGRAVKAGPGTTLETRGGQIQGPWQMFTGVDGLLDPEIYELAQDQDGYLWIGSTYLSRYDGERFVHFSVEDGLLDDHIRTLLVDRNGYLWVGSRKGVSRFDGKEFVHFTAEQGLPGNEVAVLAEDGNGHLWIGTDNGLCRYDGQRLRIFTTKDGLPSSTISALAFDQEDRLWVGTNGGVGRYDGNAREADSAEPADMRFVAFTSKDGLSNNNVRNLSVDGQGQVWVACGSLEPNPGVSRFNGERFEVFAAMEPTTLGVDHNGQIWVGGFSEAYGISQKVFRMDPANTKIVPVKAPVDIRITYIFADRAGYLWFGLVGGLARYSGTAIKTFAAADGMVDNGITVLTESLDGHIWIGTQNGLSRYDGRGFTNFRTEDGLADKHIMALAEDSLGHIWIGTRNGLSRFDGRGFTSFRVEDGLADHWIEALAVDSLGQVWIGTINGLSRYNRDGFVTYGRRDGLLSSRVGSLLVDQQGLLWVGTARGVNRYEDGRFTAFGDTSLASIESMARDGQGGVWAARQELDSAKLSSIISKHVRCNIKA